MARTATFYEFAPATKAKWERLARRVSMLAYQKSNGAKNQTWLKDEVIEHIQEVMAEDGNEIDDRRAGMYLERMRMASVMSGPEVPTLDLVSTDNGMGYQWIRDGKIPAGFLSHILSIANAIPRIAFDYFVLLSRKYSLDELIDAVKPARAMTLLLLAELYVRVHRIGEFGGTEQFEGYLERIIEFKSEVQAKITTAEAEGFNAMASGLLLSPPNN